MDGRDGAILAGFDFGAIGFGFDVVDVYADGDDLLMVFEVSAAVALEQGLRVARDSLRRAPHETGGVLIHDRGEEDCHERVPRLPILEPAWLGFVG